MTREEAIDVLKANYPDACFGQLRDAVDTAISALEQPEIIRCKDCKHWNELLNICDQTKRLALGVNGFCSNAERRTDE